MNKMFFLLAAIVIIMPSCHNMYGRHVRGNGNTSSETRTVAGFTGVETNGSIDIVVSQGSYNVKVEADQNLLQYIETTVENGRLHVRFRHGISIGDYNEAKVFVSAPELNSFETHGSGNINGEGKIADKNKIDIGIYGSGDIELNIDCPIVRTETHGSGTITSNGETRDLSIQINGSGDVKADNLKAETVKIGVHGSGDTEIFASESIDAEIYGSGDVRYKGQPKITSSIHGSGDVTKLD